MTKFINNIIGTRENKKTEFVRKLFHGCYDKPEMSDTNQAPRHYKNVELIRKGDREGYQYDIMVAWNIERKKAIWYLGHWNDGC